MPSARGDAHLGFLYHTPRGLWESRLGVELGGVLGNLGTRAQNIAEPSKLGLVTMLGV